MERTCCSPEAQLSYKFAPEEEQWLTDQGAKKTNEQWTLKGKVVLPSNQTAAVAKTLHRLTHLGTEKLKLFLKQQEAFYFLNVKEAVEQAVQNCKVCAEVNAKGPIKIKGGRPRGNRPGAHWEVDFTEVKPGKYNYRYLLVFIDTFSGWVEAFPTKHETASVVAKILLEEIIPRYGVPYWIGSDNGPAFTSKVSQKVAQGLGIIWKLHCAYHPQSSGQVERMNRTLKETLTKLTLAAGTRDWVLLLPLALYRARNTPGPHGLTPYEIMFGSPPPLVPPVTSPESLSNPISLQAHLQALRQLQKDVWQPLAAAYLEQQTRASPPHNYQVGDYVWVRRHQVRTLEPRWKGPYVVLLTTPTAVKVDRIAAWVHVSHLKSAQAPEASADQERWKVQKGDNPLKIRLVKHVP